MAATPKPIRAAIKKEYKGEASKHKKTHGDKLTARKEIKHLMKDEKSKRMK